MRVVTRMILTQYYTSREVASIDDQHKEPMIDTKSSTTHDCTSREVDSIDALTVRPLFFQERAGRGSPGYIYKMDF